jgi:hypothetical protein
MYELISAIESLNFSTLTSLALFIFKNICTSATKLFLAPKNITGNEKNTDSKKPPFIPQNKKSFKLSIYRFSKKFVCTLDPYIADPIKPTKI